MVPPYTPLGYALPVGKAENVLERYPVGIAEYMLLRHSYGAEALEAGLPDDAEA